MSRRTVAKVTIYETKGQACAALEGRYGYGPTPAAALRGLADRLDQVSGFAAGSGFAMPCLTRKDPSNVQ